MRVLDIYQGQEFSLVTPIERRIGFGSDEKAKDLALMSIFSKVADSTDLVNGMAQRLGVDVATEIANSPDAAAKKLRQIEI